MVELLGIIIGLSSLLMATIFTVMFTVTSIIITKRVISIDKTLKKSSTKEELDEKMLNRLKQLFDEHKEEETIDKIK